MYKERVLQAASGAICSGNQRLIPTIRTDFLPFGSKIVEHWHYLPLKQAGGFTKPAGDPGIDSDNINPNILHIVL